MPTGLCGLFWKVSSPHSANDSSHVRCYKRDATKPICRTTWHLTLFAWSVEGNVSYIVTSLFFVLLSACILNSRNEGYTVIKFYIYVSLSSFMSTLYVEGWATFTRQCYTKNCVLFDIHGSVHRRLLNRNTNNMQLCNRIYYSKFYWRLNMFRAAHRSSLGALNCICSLWFICQYGDRPLPRLSGHDSVHSGLVTAGHHMGI